MVAFPIEAVIGAAGSIASAAFNKSKTISPARQIRATVRGAREAGVHPLAALGSGASYQTVGGGSNVGSAIGAGLERFAAQLANQKTSEEIEAIKADTEARKAQADLFRAQSRTMISRAGAAAIGGPRLQDTPKTLKMFGGDITRDPSKFSSAQDVQDEFGDLMENIIGIPSISWSAGQALARAARAEAQRRRPYGPLSGPLR